MNLFIILFGILMLYMVSSNRAAVQINILKLEGFLLCFLTCIMANVNNLCLFILILLEIFIVKGLVIPMLLENAALKNSIKKDKKPEFPLFLIAVMGFVAFVAGAVISHTYLTSNLDIYFGVCVSTIITSLFYISTKKKLVFHSFGFIMLSYGAYLMALYMAERMPAIISLGILSDIFVCALIFFLTNDIKQPFDTMEAE